MTDTANLSMPLLMAAQAQKHVTHNEALQRLDVLVQLVAHSRSRTAPPDALDEGACFIVDTGATGPWAGHDSEIAAWQAGAWAFMPARDGWLAFVRDEGRLVAWRDGAWGPAAAAANGSHTWGVNADADEENRLTVSSEATLLTHEGGSHRLKINRNDPAKTASLVFQDAFSGRAEMGIGGDDHFTIKVSSDGAQWREALSVDPATGYCGIGGLRNATAHLEVARSINGSLNALTVRNRSASSSAHLIARFYNDTSQAGFFLNSSTRTLDGGGGGFSFYNDAGAVNFRAAGPVTLASGSGTVRPQSDNATTLGSASARWSSIWAVNGIVQTSDRREKERTGSLERVGGELVDAVEPLLFRWLEGGRDAQPSAPGDTPADPSSSLSTTAFETSARPGRRIHAGILAQDMKKALDDAGADFAVWGLDDREDETSRQWIRPDQLVYVLWAALRQTRRDLALLSGKAASDPG